MISYVFQKHIVGQKKISHIKISTVLNYAERLAGITYFGGIAILYKSDLKEGIKFLPHKNDDFVWIKLCKSFFGLVQDYFICYTYIPPENSKYYQNRKQDTWDYIEKDIKY